MQLYAIVMEELTPCKYWVYILQSDKHGRYYVGMSSEPDKRLQYHNEGINTSTKRGVPWTRKWLSQEFYDKREALSLERKIKKRGASRFLFDLQK